MNIHEVLEYGPIVASNEDHGYLLTGNGAYWNLWIDRGDRTYSNVDCYAREKDMYQTTAADLWEQGKAKLEEIINADQDAE